MTSPVKSARYREKNDVQLPAVAWLTTAGRFTELFDDQEATGTRMDSVGRLDEEVAVIEFKVGLSGRDIAFLQAGGSSIEAKISGTLGPLYRRSDDLLSNAIRACGFGDIPLRVVIVAARYTDEAIESLRVMLSQRASDWHFSYSVCRWTGDSLVEILRGGELSWPDGVQPSDIHVPKQVPDTIPRKHLGRDRFAQALGSSRSALFAAIVQAARNIGLKVGYVGNTVVFRTALKPVASAYSVGLGGHDGLIIGVDLEVEGAEPQGLPGIAVNGKGIGHRNFMRCLQSPEEFELFLALCGHSKTI